MRSSAAYKKDFDVPEIKSRTSSRTVWAKYSKLLDSLWPTLCKFWTYCKMDIAILYASRHVNASVLLKLILFHVETIPEGQ